MIVASFLSISPVEAWADQSSDVEPASGPVSERGLKREAPVFTYRQFTAQLPALPGGPNEADRDPTAFNLPAQPTFPEPAFTAGQEQAGLMGRFGRTIEAGLAQEGLAHEGLAQEGLAQADPAGAAVEAPAGEAPAVASRADEPTTTAAVAAPQAPPEARAEAAPDAGRAAFLGRGRASWYKHAGRTASGAVYDPGQLTAAHHTLPFGTKVKVVNTRNGRSVVVRITDRTNERTKAKRPYTIDLSRASARTIGIAGIGQVALYRVD